MKSAKELFGRDRAIVGMVHVGALPGTPRARVPIVDVRDTAVTEARTLVDAGCDAVLIENMHDVPYLLRDVGPEITAAMTAVGAAVRAAIGDRPLGVQVLAGANRTALAVALAIGAQFIRAEGFTFAAVADEGLLAEADAGPLLRYRRAISAEHIAVLADVKKKHSSHAITADVDIVETARAAVFCGADAVVVSGAATGRPTDTDDLRAVRDAVDVPVVVGSGTTPDTLATLFAHADAAIVGSSLKHDGRWDRPVDAARVRALVAVADAERTTRRPCR